MHEVTLTPSPGHSLWARWLDRTGVCASVGCAIHCAVAPLLLLTAPVLGGMWTHPLTHLVIAGIVLPVAALALQRGCRTHGRRWLLAVGISGMVMVLLGALWPFLSGLGSAAGSDHAHSGCGACCPSIHRDEATGAWSLHVPFASAITLLGGIALVTAHIGNLRLCAHGHHGAHAHPTEAPAAST